MKEFPSIAPLFWLKGEEQAILLNNLEQLKNNNIKECIIEARPFPGWLETPWFDTLKTLCNYAKNNNMRLWLFDDVHFPSGGAGGKIPEKFRKKLIRRRYVDIVGDGGSYCIKVQGLGTEKFFKAICAPFVLPDNFDSSNAFDVTNKVKDGKLLLELPEGRYRVFLIFITREGGENHTKDWINMLDFSAVDYFVDTVLNTHYKELEEFFNNGVIAGFFSDEPRMGSAPSYLSLPDGKFPCLPYSDELAKRLSNQAPGFWPSLWHECQDAPFFRAQYMDEVSKLYSENFPQKMGNWCNEHNVQYIGHIIEDNGAHSRLGYGNGHFFRAIKGQNFAMIDSVLHQNLPGIEEGVHSSSFGPHYSSFYQWGLGKLGSSAAHLIPSFNHQCACESFGAYGWNFNLDAMKRMTDHFLVQGINAFVPHAFSNAPYPDKDCPPHFYANGNNPQWKYFHLWSNYCHRACKLLSNGIHISGAAILYHAEAEWTTCPFTPFEEVGKKLQKEHFDYDVVPFDILEDATVKDHKMVINGETFNLLIVPSGFLLPQYKKILQNLENDGLKVLYTDEIDEAKKYLVSPIKEGASSFLRIYQYHVDGEIRILLFNESVSETIEFEMNIAGSYIYDAVYDKNYYFTPNIRLVSGESLFVIINAKTMPSKLDTLPYNLTKIAQSKVLVDETIFLDIPCQFDNKKRAFLEIEQNIGTIEITCNNQKSDILFAPPYRMEITNCIKDINHISLTVTRMPDPDIIEAPFDIEIPLKLDITCNILQSK